MVSEATAPELRGERLVDGGRVLVAFDAGVAQVQLNRPEASNGMDQELLGDLHAALLACHGHPGVRAVLLSGAGPHFCAGGDVHAFAAQGERRPDYIRVATAQLQAVVTALLQLEAPVVTAVQGFAAGGGGFGVVCASDLVVAARSARFLLGATRVGMTPDAGGSVTLPALVGHRRAMEIALTNPTLSAEQAQADGIVTRVVDDAELAATSWALAAELASGPTRALAATKRLLWSAIGTSVAAAMGEEGRVVSELSGTEDAAEGLASVIERRPPRYRGR
jgi:2-(1,2-epoxy-1,2-dihydrophenyl)acetyl-CoA isomerase